MTINHHLLLWGLYIFGQFVHVVKKANLAAASPKSNVQSLGGFILLHGPALTVRFFLSTLLFWAWWSDPKFVSNAFGHFGINFGFEVPLTGFTAGAFGYLADSGLDFVTAKVPALQKEVPVIDPSAKAGQP